MTPIQLETLEPALWGWLTAAAAQRSAPFRTPAVATAGIDGAPQVRVVVLREVDSIAWTLAFHTDVRSAKYGELLNTKSVAWLFYDPAAAVQVRAIGVASIHTDDDVADRSWASAALASRAAYASAVVPGAIIDAPRAAVYLEDEAQGEVGRPNFCVVRCQIREFDVLQLDPAGHRRARVTAGVAQWREP